MLLDINITRVDTVEVMGYNSDKWPEVVLLE